MNIFFQKFANILIQLVLILVGMMITPASPRINIINSLVRHKNGSHSFACMTKSVVATCSPRLPIFKICKHDTGRF